jgi:transposase
MPKKSLIPNKPREEWTKDEELAYLRMENEYLKKYMALVQEDERKKQRQKKDREMSRPSGN